MEKFMIQMTWPDDGVLDDVWVKVGALGSSHAQAVRTSIRYNSVITVVFHTLFTMLVNRDLPGSRAPSDVCVLRYLHFAF